MYGKVSLIHVGEFHVDCIDSVQILQLGTAVTDWYFQSRDWEFLPESLWD